jgi:hypothetical protein
MLNEKKLSMTTDIIDKEAKAQGNIEKKEVCNVCLGKEVVEIGFAGWYMGEKPCPKCVTVETI